MDIKFKIGDRVMYHNVGGKPMAGTITDITYSESGEPTGYVVRLDDERILGCSSHELAHLDLDKL
ncbi:MAG: hypothetical protein MUO43_03345 [Desulfobacterales bacterium]|nr:hypothetical protein [Desulfobacterales bacterium]